MTEPVNRCDAFKVYGKDLPKAVKFQLKINFPKIDINSAVLPNLYA